MLSIAKSLVAACIFLMLAASASINAAAPGFLEERRRMDTRLDAIVRKLQETGQRPRTGAR